jgi:hypothetical protein
MPVAARGKLRQLIRYFHRYWIGVVGVEKLSVHGLERRTNNHVESFNRNMLRRFKLSPNIWLFISKKYILIKLRLFRQSLGMGVKGLAKPAALYDL